MLATLGPVCIAVIAPLDITCLTGPTAAMHNRSRSSYSFTSPNVFPASPTPSMLTL